MNPALSSLHAGCLLGWLNGCCAVVVSIAMLIVSIILEAAVAAIAVLAAQQGRPYLYGLAFTFAAYVLYDLARLLQWPVEGRCCQACSCWRPSPRSSR